LFDGFSTSRLDSAQFLFCQQSSPWWPPVSVWPPAKVQSVQSALRGIWCYKVVLLVCESTIILLPVAGGHSGQEPLCLREACAKLARTLREIPWAILVTRAQSLQIARMLVYAIGATMLCNPFRCILIDFINLCLKCLRDFGLARSLRVHELARSLWKACARVTPFKFWKNKFHRILKSIAESFERGSIVIFNSYVSLPEGNHPITSRSREPIHVGSSPWSQFLG
jgi:hypothetical protein